MFYITRRDWENGIIGVMDTEDGVEDFFSPLKIDYFRSKGIKIISSLEMKEVIHFLWNFQHDKQDTGKHFPEALDFILGDRHDLPVYWSRGSYIHELKRDYEKVREYGFDLDLRSLSSTVDMLASRLNRLYFLKGDAHERLIDELVSRWHLDEGNLRRWYDD